MLLWAERDCTNTTKEQCAEQSLHWNNVPGSAVLESPSALALIWNEVSLCPLGTMATVRCPSLLHTEPGSCHPRLSWFPVRRKALRTVVLGKGLCFRVIPMACVIHCLHPQPCFFLQELTWREPDLFTNWLSLKIRLLWDQLLSLNEDKPLSSTATMGHIKYSLKYFLSFVLRNDGLHHFNSKKLGLWTSYKLCNVCHPILED